MWCNCNHFDNIENINITEEEIRCKFCNQKVDKTQIIYLLQYKIEEMERDFKEEIRLLKFEIEQNSRERQDREMKKTIREEQEQKLGEEGIARFSMLDIREKSGNKI